MRRLLVGVVVLAAVLGTAVVLWPGNDAHPLDLSNDRVPVGPEVLDGLDLTFAGTREAGGGDPEEVVFVYGTEADGRVPAVYMAPLTPEEEHAYQDRLLRDPAAEIDEETVASCCRASIFRPPQIVDINGVDATVASISPYDRVVLVPGNPGFVVSGSTDSLMIEAARGARSMTPTELSALVEAHRP